MIDFPTEAKEKDAIPDPIKRIDVFLDIFAQYHCLPFLSARADNACYRRKNNIGTIPRKLHERL